MEIYLDLLLLFNTLFDFVLFYSVDYILRRNCGLKRMLFTSVLGNVSILLLGLNGILLIILKLLLAIVLNIICFGFKDIRYLFKNVTYFYLMSMLMGGVVYFFDSQFMWGEEGLLTVESGLFKYLIVIFISVLCIYLYLFKFKDMKNNYSSYYNCLVYLDDNNCLRMSGFLDTGNKLRDPYTNRNIILINKNVLGNFKICNPIYVPYNSLNNHGLLECFKVKKIVIDGKESSDFLVGISEEQMFIDGIDCILNTRLMEGLK